MAEYVLQEGDTHLDVARALLAEVDDPQSVVWAPRPDVYGGGVYVVNDEDAVANAVRVLQTRRDEQAKQIDEAQRAAEARDKRADETGLTPAQLGIPASIGTDPGAPGTAGTLADVDEEDDGEPVEDDPATPEDESKMTPAQKRAAKRKRDADAAAADAAKTDGAAQEEVK